MGNRSIRLRNDGNSPSKYTISGHVFAPGDVHKVNDDLAEHLTGLPYFEYDDADAEVADEADDDDGTDADDGAVAGGNHDDNDGSADDGDEDEHEQYECGAETASGDTCSRPVDSPDGRCHMHAEGE